MASLILCFKNAKWRRLLQNQSSLAQNRFGSKHSCIFQQPMNRGQCVYVVVWVKYALVKSSCVSNIPHGEADFLFSSRITVFVLETNRFPLDSFHLCLHCYTLMNLHTHSPTHSFIPWLLTILFYYISTGMSAVASTRWVTHAYVHIYTHTHTHTHTTRSHTHARTHAHTHTHTHRHVPTHVHTRTHTHTHTHPICLFPFHSAAHKKGCQQWHSQDE